jgi:hypothetical protein
MPRSDELPDDLQALAVLNALQISGADFDADYRRLVSVIRDDVASFLLERGRWLAEQGHVAYAEEAFFEVLRFDPQDAVAYMHLGYLTEQQGRVADAVEFYRKALSSLSSVGLGEEEPLVKLTQERLRRLLPEEMMRPESEPLVLEPLKSEPLVPEPPKAEPPYFVGASAEEYAPDSLASLLSSGSFPKEAVHRDVNVPGGAEPSPVDFTIFAPDRVERDQTVLLQAFLHAPEARREAEAAAKQFDPEATERGYRSLVLDGPIGTTFVFDAEIEGFVSHERTDTLLWTGRPQAATFRFDVPKGCKLGQHVGTVRISQDGAPVGRITFQIEVVLDARKASQRPVGKEARHYHACFCSYSSLDRAEMLKRAQGLRATGLETFIDVLTLRPGDIWDPKIFEAIDESDLFVVIWSTNARDSEWVKKESCYALRHYKEHGSPDFVPIPVEGPPIASVPQDLQAYHFNDELLGQIRAAELEMLARKKKEPEC